MHPILQRTVSFIRAAVEYFRRNPTLYFLLFLNVIGLILFCWGKLTDSVSAALFLAYILLIAVTVAYFFIKGAVLAELDQHVTDIEAHPGGLEQIAQDIARLGSAVVRLDEAIGEIGQVKEIIADFDSYKKGLSAIRQDIASAMSLEDDVAKISEDMGQLKAAAVEIAKLRATVSQYDGLKQAIHEAASGREALARAINALKTQVQQLSSQADRINTLSEDINKLQKTFSEQGGGRADLGDIGPKMEQWKAAGEEMESKLRGLEDEMASVEDRLKKLDGIARAAAGEVPDAELRVELDDLKKEVAELAKASGGDVKDLGEELRREIASVKSQVEGVSEVGDINEAISTIREELAALRGRVKGGGGAADEGLREELSKLKKTVAEFAASQPKLELEIHKAKLVPQQDRTMVHCSLKIKNMSNKPNEIVAVRAELDSGRNRMTPTSVRYWLPEGQEGAAERKVSLPMRVLENSSSPMVNLTVAGWPLEKTQGSYAFRITVRDKNGNEFVKSLDLSPEKQA